MIKSAIIRIRIMGGLNLTCSPALKCHSAVEGKTSPPEKTAAWAEAHWYVQCWWVPFQPRRAPQSAVRPTFPSLRPQWKCPPPTFSQMWHKYAGTSEQRSASFLPIKLILNKSVALFICPTLTYLLSFSSSKHESIVFSLRILFERANRM